MKFDSFKVLCFNRQGVISCGLKMFFAALLLIHFSTNGLAQDMMPDETAGGINTSQEEPITDSADSSPPAESIDNEFQPALKVKLSCHQQTYSRNVNAHIGFGPVYLSTRGPSTYRFAGGLPLTDIAASIVQDSNGTRTFTSTILSRIPGDHLSGDEYYKLTSGDVISVMKLRFNRKIKKWSVYGRNWWDSDDPKNQDAFPFQLSITYRRPYMEPPPKWQFWSERSFLEKLECTVEQDLS